MIVRVICVALAIAAQTNPLINVGNGEIVVSGHDRATSSASQDLTTGEIQFKATGKPVTISAGAMGMTLQAKVVEGTAVRFEDTYRVASFKGDGVSNFDLNSASANRFRSERKMKPLDSLVDRHSVLRSDQFDYRSDAEQGLFTLPHAFEIQDDSSGTGTRKDGKSYQFSQSGTISGSRGTVTMLLPKGLEYYRLQNAEIQGPVKFKITRTESQAGLPNTLDVIEGTADRLVLDRKGEGTLKAIGNVHVTTTGQLVSTLDGDEVTVFLDPEGKPLSLRATGSPASVRAVEQKKPSKESGR